MTLTEEDFNEEDIKAVIEQAENGIWSDCMPIDEFIESICPGYFERLSKSNNKEH